MRCSRVLGQIGTYVLHQCLVLRNRHPYPTRTWQHIAAAVGTPVLALFGPSGEDMWGPWRVPARVLTSEHTCRPCGLDGCGGSKRSDCLEVIATDRVLQAAVELMEQAR